MKSLSKASTSAFSAISNHIGGIIAVIFWGLSFVSTKILMDDGGMTPTEAYVYRFTIAYALIWFFAHKRFFANNVRDELLLLLCGLSSGSIYFITENTALKFTLTSNVALLSSTSPLVTILLVGLIYRSERPGMGVVIGSIVAFVGVVLVILNSMSGGVQFEGNPIGDLLALATAVLWAVYSLILRRLNVYYDAMFITRKTFFYGLITAIPFLFLQPSIMSPETAFSKPIVVFNLLFLALGASIISFFLWARAIEKVGAVVANNYMYLQPVVALIASVILFHEGITFLGISGFVLILLGLWLGDYLQARMNRRVASSKPARTQNAEYGAEKEAKLRNCNTK